MRPRTAIAVLAPLLVLAAGFGAGEWLARRRAEPERALPEPAPPLVEVVRPGRESLRHSVETFGEIVPRAELDLVAEVGGRVTWIAPELVDGGFVGAGQPLVRIDELDFRLATARAELELARARRRLAEEEANAESALREWRRLGQGEGTPLARRELQLAEARAEVEAARAELELRRRDLERTELRAPFVARVHRVAVDVGQFVSRAQVLGRLWAIDHAEVRLPLPDAELAFLDLPLGPTGVGAANGAAPIDGSTDEDALPKVLLTARFAGADHTFPARIVRTESALDPRTRMLVAVARLEDPYDLAGVGSRPPLPVGLFVRARITGHELEQALVLPREALRGADRLWTVDETSRLRLRTVRVLRQEHGRVVLEDGLADDDRVVISPLELATEGQRVRVVELEDGR